MLRPSQTTKDKKLSEQPSEEVVETPAEPVIPEPTSAPEPVPVEARVWEDLVVRLESLTLRFQALEDAVCNLQGFERATEGSLEGRVTFSRIPAGQLPAVAKVAS
jgi:hypothetical protein